MNQRLRESYLEMANDNSSTVAPIGAAWKTARDSFPSIQLYTADGSHPSIHGSYLAACVFYATMYQNSPIGSTYIPASINSSDALNLQKVASYTVLDSLSLWGINTNKPIANFTSTGNPTVTFTNTSTNAATYSWNFGDGNTNELESPNHTYSSNNNYNVELIIYSADSCFSDTRTQSIVINTTGINDLDKESSSSIYPNPVKDFLTIKTNFKYTSISIMNVTGKTVKRIISQSKIDVRNLTNGIYFIDTVQ